MAKKKKIPRKKLLNEPDEFLTFSTRLLRYSLEYRTQLLYALTAMVVLVLCIAVFRFFSNRAENQAFTLLDQSLAQYETARKDNAPAEAFREVSPGFQRLLQKYGGNEGGKLARLIYANICYDSGEYKQAIELYKNALDDFKDHPLIYQLILSDLGYAYEQIEDYAAAAGYFEKAATEAHPVMGGEVLFNLGQLYDKLGQLDKSTAAFQRILADYQDSVYFQIVKERVAS
ncbi:MAG: tetratricopeptide repeat protein [Desulfobacterales bacterium]|nr:MAG: tetratricopeptide repeat protein [Desulfobacterales bacterium]